MPYIKQEKRTQIDKTIDVEKTLNLLTENGGSNWDPGDLNYIFTRFVWAIFKKYPNYTTANQLVGVLECVKQEFIRRHLNPYENQKIEKHGDIL